MIHSTAGHRPLVARFPVRRDLSIAIITLPKIFRRCQYPLERQPIANSIFDSLTVAGSELACEFDDLTAITAIPFDIVQGVVTILE